MSAAQKLAAAMQTNDDRTAHVEVYKADSKPNVAPQALDRILGGG